ncbi:MAG: zinc-ribbon domain-containing protein [Myxococcota bacterium]
MVGFAAAAEVKAMIVVCEKCETRFRLDPSRIGREGAKVRCSRCKHRFHVKFELPEVDPHSIAQDVVEDSSPTPSGNDADLDNPEFIHDKPLPSDQRRRGDWDADGTARSEGVLGLDAEPKSESELELDFGSVPDFSRADPEPEAASEEPAPRKSGCGGGVDLGAFRLGGAVEETGPGFRVSEADEGADSSDGAVIGDQKQPDAPVDQPKARVVPMPSSDAGGKAWLFQGVSIAAALFLASGFVRTVWIHAPRESPSAVRIEANGWTTSDVESFHVQDLAGTRILVVRGELVRGAGSSAAPPLVVGTLVDGEGRPLGDELFARPLRLDDAALSPEQLPSTLGRGAKRRNPMRSGRKGVGFTLLFNVPDPNARTVRLELREFS